MPRKDLIAALVIGEICSWLMLFIAKNLVKSLPGWWLLPIVFPILCALGMLVALLFEKRLAILYQFAKFFLVGGMNTLVDLGILNLLIFFSGISSGLVYSLFKGTSFLVATTNSYVWNKLWTFAPQRRIRRGGGSAEFGQFLVVSAIGFVINVGIASLVVNLVGPQFNLTAKTWANVGAIMGSVIGLLWNFVGYKFVVFK
jgi:putative flippase GtrA